MPRSLQTLSAVALFVLRSSCLEYFVHQSCYDNVFGVTDWDSFMSSIAQNGRDVAQQLEAADNTVISEAFENIFKVPITDDSDAKTIAIEGFRLVGGLTKTTQPDPDNGQWGSAAHLNTPLRIACGDEERFDRRADARVGPVGSDSGSDVSSDSETAQPANSGLSAVDAQYWDPYNAMILGAGPKTWICAPPLDVQFEHTGDTGFEPQRAVMVSIQDGDAGEPREGDYGHEFAQYKNQMPERVVITLCPSSYDFSFGRNWKTIYQIEKGTSLLHAQFGDLGALVSTTLMHELFHVPQLAGLDPGIELDIVGWDNIYNGQGDSNSIAPDAYAFLAVASTLAKINHKMDPENPVDGTLLRLTAEESSSDSDSSGLSDPPSDPSTPSPGGR